MKTDDFIAMLAHSTPRTPPAASARRLGVALAAGLPVAVLVMVVVLGVRKDLADAALLPMFWVKLGLPLLLAAAAWWVAERLGRPGVAVQWRWGLVALPVALLWLIGGLAYLLAAPAERPGLLFGSTWRTCPLNITMVALPLLLAGLWAMRGLAPTRPVIAGAAAGAMAGGAGAMVYALHCPEMAAPFLAVWYVLGMALPTALGALLGGKLLRW